MDSEVRSEDHAHLELNSPAQKRGARAGWHAPRERSGTPVVQIDIAAVLGGFLKELSPIDVIVELIQNELDAGSASTEIIFGDDAFVCTGNGRKIDATGWKRLVYVLGAGGEVEAKADGIGAKNHGIRSCFLLGDDIVVQCDGHRVELTLRGDMQDRERFYPAAWPKEPDEAAPPAGTRVSVGYRDRTRTVPGHNPLFPPDEAALDLLFAEALETCPNRFLFASAPGRPWDYELVLVRHGRRIALRYQARSWGKGGFFQRTCMRIEGPRSRRLVERKLCCPFLHQLAEGDTAKVPRLFRRRNGVAGEIGWRCDHNGLPLPGSGELRYPIAFPAGDIRSTSGFDISAPFVAGRARHSLGEDSRNQDLLESARDTIVNVVSGQLAARSGSDALRLLRNETYPNVAEVDLLILRLHAAGGLPLIQAEGAGRRSTFPLSSPGAPLLLAIPSYSAGAADRALAALAAGAGQVLHPGSPLFVADSLRRAGAAVGLVFNEIDAARLVFDEEAPPEKQANSSWLRRCLAAVKLLEFAWMHETLDAPALKAIKEKGRLPGSDGNAVPWKSIKRAKRVPPPVPGVVAPPLLHHALMATPIFRDGPGAVERFSIDRHLSNLDFVPASASSKTSFFAWLRKSHADLHQKTLAAIGRYPIWPGADGVHRPLDDYCWPRAAYLREILAAVGAAPAEGVISFPALGASSTSSLRLRRTPRLEELKSWHAAEMKKVEALSQNDPVAAARAIAEVEARLDRMRADKFQPREVAPSHLSVSRAGSIRPISELHVESVAVLACDLGEGDLAGRRYKALYLALDARAHPSPAALLEALRNRPDEARLLARLAAWRASGRLLFELSGEEIIPLGDELLRPDQLAFPSTTDLWGEWKRRLPSADRSPDAVKLLEEVGIIRASLREEHSRGFFAWLGAQPPARQQAHLEQVVRHWTDGRAGPQRWIQSAPGLPAIPARDGAKRFWLLPLSEATRARPSLFLADFREIQERVLADNPRLKLAISDHEGVDGSSLDALRACGVRSLRVEAGPPRRLTIEGESSAGTELEAELARLRSRATINLLPKLLPRHEARADRLHRSWRRLLKEIRGVRVAEGLLAVHSFLRREYPAPVASGFDGGTAQICVSGRSNRLMSFYEAVAGRIFEPGSPISYAYGLYRAVNDPAQGDMFATLELEDEAEDEDPNPAQPGAGGTTDKTGEGEPRKGHGLPSDANPFAPSPKPLDRLDTLTFPKTGSKRHKARRTAATDAQRHSLEEDEQIQKLKNDHYAVHCQACIGARDIGEAAPPDTYVYSPHFRRLLIQAHHVEHLQNQTGGQGAQNLLILCRHHHAQLGDQLTRAMVISALRAATPLIRNFPSGEAERSIQRHGLAARVPLPEAPHEVTFYFTNEHADAWMVGESHMSQANGGANLSGEHRKNGAAGVRR